MVWNRDGEELEAQWAREVLLSGMEPAGLMREAAEWGRASCMSVRALWWWWRWRSPSMDEEEEKRLEGWVRASGSRGSPRESGMVTEMLVKRWQFLFMQWRKMSRMFQPPKSEKRKRLLP